MDLMTWYLEFALKDSREQERKGKQERKENVLRGDSGARLAKHGHILAAWCWVHGGSLHNVLCFFCRHLHNEKLGDILFPNLPYFQFFSWFLFYSPFVEMTGIGGTSLFSVSICGFLCSVCLCWLPGLFQQRAFASGAGWELIKVYSIL